MKSPLLPRSPALLLMKRPLDELRHHRVGAVKAARIYSNVVSPPVIFAVLGLVIALWERPFWPGLIWAAVYGFTISLLPILFVLYLLKTGRIRELHMSNTRERHLPYAIAVLCAALLFAILTLFDGPQTLRCLAIFNMIELAALGIINVYWLISMHATGVMATMVIVWLVFGWQASLVVLPFVISVSWVRLYLKRHTPAQVAAGLALGVASVLMLTPFGCF
ncbi:MAG: phosphatase PAP2 family protein [Ardenticatenaceae bacterium]|nr:phosphatase PAP2 family protein [Anaerolineales bacterium]MCB8920456.1 phosphatase PAP2 family protein [Ardenticatenaceae bacterium]